MLSWCGATGGSAGVGRFLITLLQDDVRIALKASPETALDQQSMQLGQRPYRYARCADLHSGAGDRIQHPARHDGDDAGARLDVDILVTATLLAVMQADATPMERVPAIVNFDFLPDMGRMTG
jgi:hypothetical protein